MNRYFLILVLTVLSACVSTQQKSEINYPTADDYQNSKLNISYALGHNQYTLTAESKSNRILLSSHNNNQMIESTKIEKDQYLDFAKKVSDFSKNFSAKSVVPEDCNTPFSIEIRVNEKKYFVQGCRQQDKDGEFGKLIRTGEILFFRK